MTPDTKSLFDRAKAVEASLKAEPSAGATPATLPAQPRLESFALPEGAPMIAPRSLGLRAPGTPEPAKGNLWEAAWHTEGMMQAFRDVFATHGFEPVDDYMVPMPDSEEWKATVGDLPPEYWDDLAGAVSPEHFAALARVAREHHAAEETLASHGGAGVAGRIAVAMVDPMSLALGFGSGGIGWLAKGSRVAKAVKAGLVAGASNAAIEGSLAYASPTRDAHDVAYAALAGFALGGTFGYIFSRDEAVRAIPAAEAAAARQARSEVRDLVPFTGPRVVEGELVDPPGLPGGSPAQLEGGPRRVEGATAEPAPRFTRSTDRATRTADVEDAVIESEATVEEVIARMRTTSEAGETFGRDSAGAASTGAPVDEALRDIPDPGVTVAQTQFRGLRFDIASRLRGAGQGVRNLVGRYVGDSVGAKKGEITELGGSEHAARHHERFLAKFYSGLTPTYNEWAKDAGKGLLGKWGRRTRREFNELVTSAIRRPSAILDPQAAKAAAEVRKVFSEVLAEAQAAGVKGFEKVADNPNYVPRVFNHKKLFGLIEEFGQDGVVGLVRGAMRSRIPVADLDDDLLDVLAKGYVKRLREVGMGLDTTLTHGIGSKDFDAIAGLIRASGATEDQITEIMGRFKALAARSDTGEGSVRYSKLRFDLDEDFAVQMTSKNGTTRTVRLDEMFENDIEHLMGRYVRSMSGHIGMAKIGVRSFDDHKKNLEGIAALLEGQPDEARKLMDTADLAYKLVTGQPVEKLGDVARWSRFLRDYNFVRTMNQAGFAQIPDLAALFSKAYLRHTLKHLPEFVSMMRRGADGKLRDSFARELEEILGVGTDYHNVAVFSMFDLEADGFAGFLGKAEHAMRVMGRGTQAMSGMAAITASAQRLAAKAIVQRFVSGSWSPERLAALGIDESLWARIQKGLNDHADLVPLDSGRKVKQLNMGMWKDVEARDAFLAAVHKEARRMVQEEDVGDTAEFMHKSLWKVVIQFRRFGLVSYTKQLLHGANHADAQTATHMMMSFALAGMAYWAQQQVRMAGMDERKRREWEKKYLEPERLAAAAFARSSFSSLLPAVSDSITSILLGTKAFDVRASGQPSDAFGGISSVDAANKFAKVTGKSVQSLLRDDRRWTERDLDAFRGLLPYGNLIPMQFGFEALVKPTLDLPAKQRDRNRDEIDWSFD
jgi:hypothetical protein